MPTPSHTRGLCSTLQQSLPMAAGERLWSLKVSLRVPHSTPCSSGDRQCHPPMSHSKVGREVLPAADPAQGHSKGTKQGLKALWSWSL